MAEDLFCKFAKLQLSRALTSLNRNTRRWTLENYLGTLIISLSLGMSVTTYATETPAQIIRKAYGLTAPPTLTIKGPKDNPFYEVIVNGETKHVQVKGEKVWEGSRTGNTFATSRQVGGSIKSTSPGTGPGNSNGTGPKPTTTPGSNPGLGGNLRSTEHTRNININKNTNVTINHTGEVRHIHEPSDKMIQHQKTKFTNEIVAASHRQAAAEAELRAKGGPGGQGGQGGKGGPGGNTSQSPKTRSMPDPRGNPPGDTFNFNDNRVTQKIDQRTQSPRRRSTGSSHLGFNGNNSPLGGPRPRSFSSDSYLSESSSGIQKTKPGSAAAPAGALEKPNTQAPTNTLEGTCKNSEFKKLGSQALCNRAASISQGSNMLMFMPMMFAATAPPAQISLPGQTQTAQSLITLEASDEEAAKQKNIQMMMVAAGGAMTASGIMTVNGLKANQAEFAQRQAVKGSATDGKVTDHAILENAKNEMSQNASTAQMATGMAGVLTVASFMQMKAAATTLEKNNANRSALLSLTPAVPGATPPGAAGGEDKSKAEAPAPVTGNGEAAQTEAPVESNLAKDSGNTNDLGKGFPDGGVPTDVAKGPEAGGFNPNQGGPAGGGGDQGFSGGSLATNPSSAAEEGRSPALANSVDGSAFESSSAPTSGGAGGGGGGGGDSAAAGGPDMNELMALLEQQQPKEGEEGPARNILFAGRDDDMTDDSIFAQSDRDLFMMISEAMIAKARFLSE